MKGSTRFSKKKDCLKFRLNSRLSTRLEKLKRKLRLQNKPKKERKLKQEFYVTRPNLQTKGQTPKQEKEHRNELIIKSSLTGLSKRLKIRSERSMNRRNSYSYKN